MFSKANDVTITPEEVRETFFLTDKDKSGDLDLDEFEEFCANTKTVFVAVDKERRKKGDKQPWNKGIPKVPVSPDKVDKAEMAFKLYDKDKDGFVTKYEMNRLAKKLTTDQIDQVISGPQTTTLVMSCSH